MSKHLVYTRRTSGFEKGSHYRHPAYFDGKPEEGVEKVTVEGEYPRIVEAYQAAGVEVTDERPKPKTTRRKKAAEPTEE